jgi:hypothetical protein
MLKKTRQNSQKQPLPPSHKLLQNLNWKKIKLLNQKQRQKLKQDKQNDSYLRQLHYLKLNAVKKKLGVGTGKAFSNVCVVIFKIFSYATIIGGGIAVAAWYLIIKPIFGVLNPLNLVKKMNPVKLFKK